MDCSDVERALIHGEKPEGAELEAHLAGCETCRFLVDDGVPVAQALAASSGPPSPVDELDVGALEAATLAQVAGDRGPIAALRALPRLVRLGLLTTFTALGCAYFYDFYRRPDWAGYPPARMILALAAFVGLGLVLAWTSLRPLWLRPLSDRSRRVLVAIGLALPFVLAVLPEVESGWKMPASMSLVGLAYACNALGGAFGFLVYLVLRTVDRGGATSTLTAVGAGLLGILAVQIHCPVNAIAHLCTGHATIPLVLVGATLLLRRL